MCINLTTSYCFRSFFPAVPTYYCHLNGDTCTPALIQDCHAVYHLLVVCLLVFIKGVENMILLRKKRTDVGGIK